MLRNLTEDNGSVLMEFIIVMPIYFLLLGSVFLVGELALHSIHLSASGDRNIACTDAGDSYSRGGSGVFQEVDFWRLFGQVLSFDCTALTRRNSPATDYSYGGNQSFDGRDSVSKFSEKLDTYARKRVLPQGGTGHWTEAVAGRALDNYTLTPLTRGMVAHWFYEVEKRVYDDKLMKEKLNRAAKDDIDTIFDNKGNVLGRVQMKGNYYEDGTGNRIRDYGYFALRRSDDGRWWTDKGEESQKPYRYWTSAELANNDKWQMALDEKTATVRLGVELYISKDTPRGAAWTETTDHTGGGDGAVTYEFSDLL